mmetsp:Transcript_5957/g.15823  ORF Transcript_5957/g.15823 Transcript_5957/m.15823 type:complete len:1086 (-) Transcript_5957:281-3538(-)
MDGLDGGKGQKRAAEEEDGLGSHGGKAARVEEDRVDKLPGGANLIACDGKSCSHEVAWPPGQDGSPLPPPKREGPPAKQYPFTIDPFQQTSVNCLEAGHSVLVAAHTSAGKTVVAEYAFAMALRDKARVVYTSPLKALSNQKYREFYETFSDVGLITGDVVINPNASCLVMTTEILRSMLYRGSEVVREVSLIVYDEIHYLRDKERGVVWEESIVLAPKSARFAFLSATIPNAREFAQWVAKVHGSPCHVVYTDYRPTPLQHYIFPAGGDGLFMVVDEGGIFREDNFQKAITQLNDAGADGKNGKKMAKASNKPGEAQGEKSDIFKITKMIMERNYEPVIVFSFSKKECEKLALNMAQLDLNDEDEKKLVDTIYWNAMDCLSEDDQRLPQVNAILPMLKRGIGVHHSGLLPIVKEVIEVLFQEGLLKALFATETFSTGLNMPAKTVVFTNVRKYDGGSYRWISSGEYIQMSGRAGRRGLDDRGIVILMLDARLEPATAKDMIKGAPDNLYSEFHLGYNMLLNLMRVEGADPEALLGLSFKQFQMERSLPQLEARTEALRVQRDAIEVEDAVEVERYLALLEQYASLCGELRSAMDAPRHCLPFLQPGRLVRVMPEAYDPKEPLPQFGSMERLPVPDGVSSDDMSSSSGTMEATVPGVWGAIVNFERVGKKDSGGGAATGASSDEDDEAAGLKDSEYKGKHKSKRASKKKHKRDRKDGDSGASNWVVDVLVNCEPGWNGSSPGIGQNGKPRLRVVPSTEKTGNAHVVTFPLSQIDRLSSVRIYIQKDLRPLEARQTGVRSIGEAVGRLLSAHSRVPLLDPMTDLKIDDKAVRKAANKLESVESALRSHPLASHPDLRARLALVQQRQELEEAMQASKREAKAAAGLILREELRARQRVLRRLGYVTSEGVVTLKGRVAAGIATGDELVLCEMIFGGAFNPMTIEQITATCSCFVWREKSEAGPKLPEDLVPCLAAVRDAAKRVTKVAAECKMPDMSSDYEEYVASFRPDIMEPVTAWVRGARFAELSKMTEIFEGSLVRAVRRLEELLRQLKEALEGVGETLLAARFEEASNRMRRDIIFAASLYL